VTTCTSLPKNCCLFYRSNNLPVFV